MPQRGVRRLKGVEFFLAGRGTKAHCQQEANSFRRSWLYVRVLPYGWGNFGAVIDDWSIWVHGRKSNTE